MNAATTTTTTTTVAVAVAVATVYVTAAKGRMVPAIAAHMEAEGYPGGPNGAINIDIDVGEVVVCPDKELPMVLVGGCLQTG